MFFNKTNLIFLLGFIRSQMFDPNLTIEFITDKTVFGVQTFFNHGIKRFIFF
jgi:hypothetical protein